MIIIIKIMIMLGKIAEAGLCSLIFIICILISQAYIQYLVCKSNLVEQKINKSKIKINIMTLCVLFLMMYTYFRHCNNCGIGFLQCFFIDLGRDFIRSMAIALFINTTLFLGGLHQQLYNGGIKKKFMRFYKKQFQWGLFKKLFIVPLYAQIVYRAIFCRIIDPKMDHPTFFTFFSGTIYGICHIINFFKFKSQYGTIFSYQAIAIRVGYNFLFGLYVSHIFSKSTTLISSLVLQVYANFMGYPEYFEILKGETQNDRIRKSALFYLFGVIGCLSLCLLL